MQRESAERERERERREPWYLIVAQRLKREDSEAVLSYLVPFLKLLAGLLACWLAT